MLAAVDGLQYLRHPHWLSKLALSSFKPSGAASCLGHRPWAPCYVGSWDPCCAQSPSSPGHQHTNQPTASLFPAKAAESLPSNFTLHKCSPAAVDRQALSPLCEQHKPTPPLHHVKEPLLPPLQHKHFSHIPALVLPEQPKFSLTRLSLGMLSWPKDPCLLLLLPPSPQEQCREEPAGCSLTPQGPNEAHDPPVGRPWLKQSTKLCCHDLQSKTLTYSVKSMWSVMADYLSRPKRSSHLHNTGCRYSFCYPLHPLWPSKWLNTECRMQQLQNGRQCECLSHSWITHSIVNRALS